MYFPWSFSAARRWAVSRGRRLAGRWASALSALLGGFTISGAMRSKDRASREKDVLIVRSSLARTI
jgi:hypothetical protein